MKNHFAPILFIFLSWQGFSQTVAFQLGSSSAVESTATHFVVVQLSTGAPLGAQLTVDVTDLGTGTALSGTDYTAPGTITLTFAAGSADLTTQTAPINITQDSLVEGSEAIDLLLSNVSGGSLGGTTDHELTITDDEIATVAFDAATSTTAFEDVVGTHSIVIDLTVTSGASLAADVVVDLADLLTGTATSGADYSALSIPLQVTFPAGSTSGATQTIGIPITVDPTVEGNESINVNIFNITGPASIGATDEHQAVILDDDGAFVSFRDYGSTVAETAGATNLIVELSIPAGPTPTTAAFMVDVLDLFTGSATFGVDFTAGFLTTLTFPIGSADGATQVLPITDDTDGETDETIDYFLFNLSGGGGIGVILGAPVNHTVTIEDDEITTVTFQSASSIHSEGGGWIHVDDGLAASDDLYSDDLRIAVGRIPARRRAEIVAWSEKLADFQPPNRAALLADRDDSQGGVDSFALMQQALAEDLPSVLIETTHRGGEDVRVELADHILAGARLVAYQGHAGFQEVGDSLIDAHNPAAIPPSSWILGTCLTGSYFVNNEALPTLARELLGVPNGGAVSIICSTRFGHADEEHSIVQRSLELMAGGASWGETLLTLKREMTGDTIKVYTLLGDPALGGLDFSERRALHLRTPQAGAVVGGPDPVRISFALTGDGWWDETVRVSWSQNGSAWAPISDIPLTPGVRDYNLDWNPPADGAGYSIRLEILQP